MNQKVVPVISSVGKVWGRDAIYLDKVHVLGESTFELTGKFNGTLCENLEDNSFHKFKITFRSVLMFKMMDLDYDEIEYKSSFDLIENSEQIARMIKEDQEEYLSKVDDTYKHIVFRTYDTVFEVIGLEYELELT